MSIGRVLNVVIPSNNYEKSIDLYRNSLGFLPLHEDSSCCFMNAGGVNIVIHRVKPDTEFQAQGRCIYLDIVVDDIIGTMQHLRKHNVTIKKEWRDSNGNFLLIEDPNG